MQISLSNFSISGLHNSFRLCCMYAVIELALNLPSFLLFNLATTQFTCSRLVFSLFSKNVTSLPTNKFCNYSNILGEKLIGLAFGWTWMNEKHRLVLHLVRRNSWQLYEVRLSYSKIGKRPTFLSRCFRPHRSFYVLDMVAWAPRPSSVIDSFSLTWGTYFFHTKFSFNLWGFVKKKKKKNWS